MSLQHALSRARTCVQRGQIDAAIKLYRGLLVSFAHHPQVNADLGLLLLQQRTAQEATPYLNRAVAALPTAFQPWVCLVIAHQRCGDLVSAREVLGQMHAQGFDAAQLAMYEQELNEPTPEAVQALTQLIDTGPWNIEGAWDLRHKPVHEFSCTPRWSVFGWRQHPNA